MSIITPLFILLLLHQTNANIVSTTCKSTPNYQLCVQTLSKDPRSSSADVRGLGLIAVDVLKAKTIAILKRINALKKTNPRSKGPLTVCGQCYDAVLNADIPEAVEALTKGDPKFAEDGVADAAVEAQECERNFKGLSDMNKGIENWSNVARAIIRMLL